jgi:CheY-like chemotaxis protein
VVARALETSRPGIDARGHRLHVSTGDQQILMTGDSLRLTQVLVNILNNAAKYTPESGDIWLDVQHLESRAEIRVRDSGRGIERDSIDRVFDLFMQVDVGAASALGGLGVGLALVRRIVELHGGSVRALSDGLGKGSEFVVRLPIAGERRAIEAEAPSKTQFPAAALAACRILVVDDNVDAANSLASLMKALGHEARTAFDGPSGIAAAHEFGPDIVMLDIGMPGMNGYDVARALRAELPGCVIVAITGWGHDGAKRKSREAGIEHHLVKPVGEPALIELLAKISESRATS